MAALHSAATFASSSSPVYLARKLMRQHLQCTKDISASAQIYITLHLRSSQLGFLPITILFIYSLQFYSLFNINNKFDFSLTYNYYVCRNIKIPNKTQNLTCNLVALKHFQHSSSLLSSSLYISTQSPAYHSLSLSMKHSKSQMDAAKTLYAPLRPQPFLCKPYSFTYVL